MHFFFSFIHPFHTSRFIFKEIIDKEFKTSTCPTFFFFFRSLSPCFPLLRFFFIFTKKSISWWSGHVIPLTSYSLKHLLQKVTMNFCILFSWKARSVSSKDLQNLGIISLCDGCLYNTAHSRDNKVFRIGDGDTRYLYQNCEAQHWWLDYFIEVVT